MKPPVEKWADVTARNLFVTDDGRILAEHWPGPMRRAERKHVFA